MRCDRVEGREDAVVGVETGRRGRRGLAGVVGERAKVRQERFAEVGGAQVVERVEDGRDGDGIRYHVAVGEDRRSVRDLSGDIRDRGDVCRVCAQGRSLLRWSWPKPTQRQSFAEGTEFSKWPGGVSRRYPVS